MNLTNYYTKEILAKTKTKIKKIFFFRVCGTGMGTAAYLLKSAGYSVEGYDIEYFPPMSTYLESTGITLHKKISQAKLQGYDLIVTGNIVRRNSDDAHMIEECGTPFASFPATLGALLLDDREVVGIAGTHGKTTTTWLATQVYENLGKEPGYFIGGVPSKRNSAQIGKEKFFIESDEYDSAYFEKFSKFRQYSLNHMILTSLEFDHADIFNNINQIINEFKSILPDIEGNIISNNEYPAIEELYKLGTSPANWIFYGEKSKTCPIIVETSHDSTKFIITTDEEHVFTTNITGYHNILNLASVILFALKDGFETSQINSAIKNLGMVKRRQENRGLYKNSIVIDDFAHHPRAIKVTIDAIIQKYPDKKIITFIEPKSATARSNIFQNEFAEALEKSQSVLILQPNPTTVKFASDLDTQKIVQDLAKKNIPAKIINELPQLIQSIEDNAKDNNLLLFLSNSTCLGLWESEFIHQLTN